ncbi:hypothetical protein JHK84_045019 [Glycine max]|nr:hypothetical protein JHK86_044967 [Glycine max]KAG4951666.1 hypothetical protein JHK85_045533 [Glycine max]KAG5108112.1 hypothetical protein JHK84_045019 [Glycine max]
MDNLSERAKSYIQMEEISRFKNEVRHAGQKHDKQEGSTKNDSHKLDTRHKPDKHQPLPKGPRVRQDQILQIPLQLRPQHKRLLVPQGQDRRAHAGWVPSVIRKEAEEPPSRSETRRTPRGLA